jgi:hypothetical protein
MITPGCAVISHLLLHTGRVLLLAGMIAAGAEISHLL